METTKIKVSTTINTDIEKVWNFWTNPEYITQWNFATDSWHCPEAKVNLQVGGKYYTRMEAKDGSFGFDFEAVYNEIKKNDTITYTMTDGRKATTRFETEHQKTKVTTVFDAESSNPIAMQRDGWQAILNNFKKFTETH